MNFTYLTRHALGVCAVAGMLAGCSGGGGSQSALVPAGPTTQNPGQQSVVQPMGKKPPFPPTISNTTRDGFTPSGNRDKTASWMDPSADGQNLVYVSDLNTGDVDVFSYREGHLKGKLTGFNLPYGLCADQAGNVWITDFGNRTITEYGHASTTPIKTFQAHGAPIGCSVNPINGDLAVANFYGGKSGYGDIVVFPGATGDVPTIHRSERANYYWPPGYDNKGNLYFEAYTKSGDYRLMVIPTGQEKMMTLSLKQAINFAGAVQFDGRYVSASDQAFGSAQQTGVYQLSVTGTVATLVSASVLQASGACTTSDIVQPWLPKLGSGKTLPIAKKAVAGNLDCASVGFYDYPAGGTPTKVLTGDGIEAPGGVTVSRANNGG